MAKQLLRAFHIRSVTHYKSTTSLHLQPARMQPLLLRLTPKTDLPSILAYMWLSLLAPHSLVPGDISGYSVDQFVLLGSFSTNSASPSYVRLYDGWIRFLWEGFSIALLQTSMLSIQGFLATLHLEGTMCSV